MSDIDTQAATAVSKQSPEEPMALTVKTAEVIYERITLSKEMGEKEYMLMMASAEWQRESIIKLLADKLAVVRRRIAEPVPKPAIPTVMAGIRGEYNGQRALLENLITELGGTVPPEPTDKTVQE